jgi:hypothetical protein
MFWTLFWSVQIHSEVHNVIHKPVGKLSIWLQDYYVSSSQSDVLFTNLLMNFIMNVWTSRQSCNVSKHSSKKLFEINSNTVIYHFHNWDQFKNCEEFLNLNKAKKAIQGE